MRTAEAVYRMIPDASVVCWDGSGSPDITVVAQGESSWQVTIGETCIRTHRPEDIVSLVEGLLEVRRQEVGVCHLHATAVVRGENAIVIFGGANSGKTTLALSMRVYGWDFAYDDKVLIAPERREIVGGRPYVRAAEHLVLAGLLPGPPGPLLPLPRSGGLPPWHMVALIRPFLSHLASDAALYTIAPNELPWEIYPRLSETISLPRHIRMFDEALPGLDTRSLASWRARAVATLCHDCPAAEVMGESSVAASLVESFIQNSSPKPER
jgi:hypothetical protein